MDNIIGSDGLRNTNNGNNNDVIGTNSIFEEAQDVIDSNLKPGSTNQLTSLDIITTYCGPCDEEYYMKHPRRGKAIIFNHVNFDPYLPYEERLGSNKDAEDLKNTFQELDFIVETYIDVRRDKLFAILKKESANSQLKDDDCIVVIVLSHGVEEGISAYDGLYKPEELWRPFTADNCPFLAGKPKLFFIQACRGDKLDRGTSLIRSSSTPSPLPPLVSGRMETDGGRNSVLGDSNSDFVGTYKIPNEADFLVVYSTPPGHVSWRNQDEGSWMMQELCLVFGLHGRNMDVHSMILTVNRQVAIHYKSESPQDYTKHEKKQVPHVSHTLTRHIRFYKNETHENGNNVTGNGVTDTDFEETVNTMTQNTENRRNCTSF